jgi:hypothetical protein
VMTASVNRDRATMHGDTVHKSLALTLL